MTMKCCVCGKAVDVDHNEVPPTWYARYLASEPIKAICAGCIRTDDGKAVWDDQA